MSAYCGKYGDACRGCSVLPKLEAFREWKARTAAVEVDPVWSGGLWRATR